MKSDAAGPTPIDPDAILRQPFSTVRKGYDPLEVQKYLMAIAGELRVGRDRERDLERQLAVAQRHAEDLENTSPQRLTAMLGEETAKVIEAANAAAAGIRTKAEENVARLLRDAQENAGKMHREAETILESKTAEAEEAASAILARAEELLQQARANSESEAEAGQQRGREMIIEAQRVRERTLRELARRRKTLSQQIEQLQAGRERLVEAFAVIRETLDMATNELEVVLPEAKVAADAALQRAVDKDDAAIEDEIAALTAEVDAALDDGESSIPDDEKPASDVVESGIAPEPAVAQEPSSPDESDPEQSSPDDESGPDEVESGHQGRRAPDPVAGRHSSAVTVIAKLTGGAAEADADGMGSAARVASLFARIKHEATAEEVHGEAAARLIPTDQLAEEIEEAASNLTVLPLDERCARVLAELERNLGRQVKRELSDEQNEILDAVRREKTTPSANDVLPDPEDHVERYASAAYAPLSDAAVAGGQLLPADARAGTESPRMGGLAREVAAELAAELVAPLRGRLEACFANATRDEDESDLTESVRSCYREWRTRVDPASGQAVVTAFNRGALAAVSPGVPLRWHLDPTAAGCTHCQQNAAAGASPAGEPFPSGHEAPPIHDGCRCVLASAEPEGVSDQT